VAHFLDGLPLALELAAARLALLSPDQLRARLESSPDLLKEAGGNRPDRHRSLRATVDWTLRLLDDPARTLFERMGVFAGAVELEEIEAIVGADGLDVLDALAGLLDVALVRRVEPGDGRVRLGLPEALRQIAAERLDAAPDGERWRRAHAQRQLELAWAARTTWVTRDVLDTALAAGAEAAAALRWSRMTADPLAARLGAARGSILNFSGRAREALEVLEPWIEHPSGEPAVDALAFTARASALLLTGRIDVALETVERAMALEGDLESQAIALMVRGMGRLFRGDHEGALRDHQQATDIARDLGPAALYVALGYEARVRLLAGDQEGAGLRLDEAERVGLPIEGRNPRHELEALRGDLAVRTGHPVRAAEHYARALEDAQLRGDDLQVLAGLGGLVRAFLALERDAEALELIGIAKRRRPSSAAGRGSGDSDSCLQAASWLRRSNVSVPRQRPKSAVEEARWPPATGSPGRASWRGCVLWPERPQVVTRLRSGRQSACRVVGLDGRCLSPRAAGSSG
jgi:tetratricopeptide (TPR) repeat protein